MGYRLSARIAGREVRYLLKSGAQSVGASPDNNLVLADPTVSRCHARIDIGDGGLMVEDLGSRNGTRVNGRPALGLTPVGAGDQLQFGDVVTLVEQIAEEDLEPAVPGREQEPVETDVGGSTATLDGSRLGRLVTRSLIPLLRAVREGANVSQTAVAVLTQCFPETAFQLHRDGPEGPLLAEGENPPGGDAGMTRYGHLCLVWRAPPHLHPDIEAASRVVLELASLGTGKRNDSRPEDVPEMPTLPQPETRHPGLRRIYQQALRVARGRIGVLIEGESGTGKELLAGYVHEASGLAADRLVVLNCAALPENLLEAELFGIEKGVATGVDARPGKFELADGGALFLDEIGEMSPATQSKILRVLQEGSVYRVGGAEPRSARVRIIAATNRRIERMVEEGEFRSDLYHRIAGWSVRLPALAERPMDIVNLAAWFLERELERRGMRFGGISVAAAERLRAYAWPGNVRELELEMSRAALFLEDGEMVDSGMLADRIREHRDDDDNSLESRLKAAEARAIREALALTDGNVSEAARRLEIGRSTLYRRMRELGVSDNGSE